VVRADPSIAAALTNWWRQPDHFGWLTVYLRAQRMLSTGRLLMSTTTLALAVAGAVLLLSGHGPQVRATSIWCWASIAGVTGCAMLWLIGWPSKRRSLMFILALNLCFAVFCGFQSDRLAGLIGAAAFTLTGGYIACWHTARYLTYNIGVASYVVGLQVFRCVQEGTGRIALAAAIFVLALNIFVPFGVQAIVHALGIAVLHSDRDPLTGLLTRRAFFRRISALLEAGRGSGLSLLLTMIDLDRFKHLNDTSGHAVGDEALIAVGRVLSATVRDGALVGRIGGEEFMVAELTGPGGHSDAAQRLCEAIAAVPYPVTASVGTANARIDDFTFDEQVALVDRLCISADATMYEAKRRGGNQVCHHHAGEV